MTKKYGFWQVAGDITAAVLAVPTCGASMVLSPTARGLVGNILGGGGDDNDSEKKIKELEIKSQEWKAQLAANQLEVERLRKEREKDEKKIKNNDEELNRLRAILNNPNASEEDKNRARQKVVLLESENRKLKDENRRRSNQIDEKSKAPPAPGSSLGYNLPKLGRYDKFLIAAVLLMLIYFLFLRDNKNK